MNAGPLLQLVTFRRGNTAFALDVHCVRRVLRPDDMEPVAGGPRFVAGRVKFEGRREVLVDPAVLLGDATDPSSAPRAILVRADDHDFGFLADSIDEVLQVEATDVLKAPPFIAGQHQDLIHGAISRDELEVLWLDVNRLVAAAGVLSASEETGSS